MNSDPITFHPIGVIRSPFKDPVGIPIQPGGARGIRGEVEVDPAFAAGLTDLEEFSRIILLYAFHRSEGTGCGLSRSLKPVSTGSSPPGCHAGRTRSASPWSGSSGSKTAGC